MIGEVSAVVVVHGEGEVEDDGGSVQGRTVAAEGPRQPGSVGPAIVLQLLYVVGVV